MSAGKGAEFGAKWWRKKIFSHSRQTELAVCRKIWLYGWSGFLKCLKYNKSWKVRMMQKT